MRDPAGNAPLVHARVGRPDASGGSLETVEWLTPYAAETLMLHARRAGPGREVTLTLPGDASDGDVDALRGRFMALVASGIRVSVGRGRPDGGRADQAA